jgi:hypothetical protein
MPKRKQDKSGPKRKRAKQSSSSTGTVIRAVAVAAPPFRSQPMDLFDPSMLPWCVWLNGILANMQPTHINRVPQISRYFARLLVQYGDDWFALWWRTTRSAEIPLHPAFQPIRMRVLYSSLQARCLFCGGFPKHFLQLVPCWVCWRCSGQSPWTRRISTSQVPRQFHITKKQCDLVLAQCQSFIAPNYITGDSTTWYLINEVAQHVFALFGGQDVWRAHWDAGEERRRQRGVEPSWLQPDHFDQLHWSAPKLLELDESSQEV